MKKRKIAAKENNNMRKCAITRHTGIINIKGLLTHII